MKQNTPNKFKKAFVLSLDGASQALLTEMIDEGHMPSLDKLMSDSSFGDLISTDPPLTPTAWVSIFSGLSPGKHGIFDFIVKDKNGAFKPINSTQVKADLLWDYVGAADRKVIVLNQPITYPTYKINGLMVSDHIFTPRNATDAFYPESFGKEIESALGPCKIFNDVTYSESRIAAVLNDYCEELEYKLKMFEYLDEKKEWDLFILYFWSLDHIQHSMMHIYDKSHPDFRKDLHFKYYDKITEYFRLLDSCIGKIINKVKQRSSVFMVSDHGLCPLKGYLHLNTWLLQKGYIRLKNNPLVLLKKILFKVGFTPESIFKIVNELISVKQVMPMLASNFNKLLNVIFLSFNDIDLKKTTAFAKGNYGQIYINKSRADTTKTDDEIMNSLKSDLMTWKNGDEEIVKTVLFKNQIYQGPETPNAPDIIFYPNEYKYKALGSLDFNSNKTVTKSFGITGYHNHSGIFMAIGDEIKRNYSLKAARDEDVFPTILTAMGLSIPEGIDGKVLKDIFLGDSGSSEATMTPKKSDRDFSYSKKEQSEIEDRLKNLGYI